MTETSIFSADRKVNSIQIKEAQIGDYLTLTGDKAVIPMSYDSTDGYILRSSQINISSTDPNFYLVNSIYDYPYIFLHANEHDGGVDEQYVQVFNMMSANYPVTTFKSFVNSFTMTTSSDSNGENFNIYTLQQNSTSSKSYTLKVVTLNSYSVLTNIDSITVDNCGDYIKVTTYLIMLGCPSYNQNTGKVSIYTIDGL